MIRGQNPMLFTHFSWFRTECGGAVDNAFGSGNFLLAYLTQFLILITKIIVAKRFGR